MRTRVRFVAFVVVAASTLGSLALAQTRAGKHGRSPKPQSTASKAPSRDVGVSRATDDADAGVPDASLVTDAGEPRASSDLAQGQAPVEQQDGGPPRSPLEPTPQEMPKPVPDAGPPVDYDKLLADVAALRARVAAVSDGLYRSRVAIAVENDSDHAKITALRVSVDDGVVFTAPKAFAASEPTVVYDHALAPGRHAVTLDIDRQDDRNDAFRTSQRNRFTIEVAKDHRVSVLAKLIDDSDMGDEFPEDKDGEYDLRLRVRVTAEPTTK